MALDGTYAGLKASAADWLNRADLTSQIADFITLAEAGFNRELRVIQMESRVAAAFGDEFASVPDDWLETRSLKLQIGTVGGVPPLEYVGEEEMADLKTRLLTGYTRYYTIVNGAFDLYPAPSSGTVLELNYYARIPALTDANTSNWLLLKSPDLYLWSTLAAAEAFLKNDDRLPVWTAARADSIDKMNLESERAKRNTTQLTARRRSFG